MDKQTDLQKAAENLGVAMREFIKTFVETIQPVIRDLQAKGYIDEKGNVTEKGQALIDGGKK